MADPIKAQYNGGIIVNPEINDGLNGWTTHGGVRIESRASKTRNKFLVAHGRKQPLASVSQKIYLDREKLYTFSGMSAINFHNPSSSFFSLFFFFF